MLARRALALVAPSSSASRSLSFQWYRIPLVGAAAVASRRRSFSSVREQDPISGDGVIVTKACADRIKSLVQSKQAPHLLLRLSVDSGGCSGFQYNFELEEEAPGEDDVVFEKGGAKLVVDEASLEFVRGATIDFEQDMMRSAFAVVNNPNSESACGCGSSFAMKKFGLNPAKD